MTLVSETKTSMNIKFIPFLLAQSLMTGLYGCQPDAPSQSVAPIVAAPVVIASQAVAVAAAPGQTGIHTGVPSDAVGRKLAQSSNCFACHAIDKKLIGPAWNDVAAKYRGQKDAEAKLVAKVAKGGSGVWGGSPMPPNSPRVSQDDIRALVRFILALK